MLKKMFFKTAAISIGLFLAHCVYAEASKMVPASTIKGLDQVLDGAKHASNMSVYFPTTIPVSKAPQLYASFASYARKPDFNQFFQINAGSTATCKGAHFCNIGYISAEKNGKLNTTGEKITLRDGTVAYFFTGHAEADFHAPAIEWQKNQALYILSWNLADNVAKDTLVAMANSALK